MKSHNLTVNSLLLMLVAVINCLPMEETKESEYNSPSTVNKPDTPRPATKIDNIPDYSSIFDYDYEYDVDHNEISPSIPDWSAIAKDISDAYQCFKTRMARYSLCKCFDGKAESVECCSSYFSSSKVRETASAGAETVPQYTSSVTGENPLPESKHTVENDNIEDNEFINISSGSPSSPASTDSNKAMVASTETLPGAEDLNTADDNEEEAKEEEHELKVQWKVPENMLLTEYFSASRSDTPAITRTPASLLEGDGTPASNMVEVILTPPNPRSKTSSPTLSEDSFVVIDSIPSSPMSLTASAAKQQAGGGVKLGEIVEDQWGTKSVTL